MISLAVSVKCNHYTSFYSSFTLLLLVPRAGKGIKWAPRGFNLSGPRTIHVSSFATLGANKRRSALVVAPPTHAARRRPGSAPAGAVAPDHRPTFPHSEQWRNCPRHNHPAPVLPSAAPARRPGAGASPRRARTAHCLHTPSRSRRSNSTVPTPRPPEPVAATAPASSTPRRGRPAAPAWRRSIAATGRETNLNFV